MRSMTKSPVALAVEACKKKGRRGLRNHTPHPPSVLRLRSESAADKLWPSRAQHLLGLRADVAALLVVARHVDVQLRPGLLLVHAQIEPFSAFLGGDIHAPLPTFFLPSEVDCHGPLRLCYQTVRLVAFQRVHDKAQDPEYQGLTLFSDMVPPRGFEPRTHGLRIRCSAG